MSDIMSLYTLTLGEVAVVVFELLLSLSLGLESTRSQIMTSFSLNLELTLPQLAVDDDRLASFRVSLIWLAGMTTFCEYTLSMHLFW